MASPTISPNSGRATGPRTPEGKARSAQNARKHGLSAVTLNVLPSEQAQFENYQNDLLSEINPQKGVQADLFRQLVHAGWSLVRLERFELEILAEGNPFKSPEAQQTLDRLERYRASHRRAYSRILAEITKLQTKAMLWSTTHSSVQENVQNEFPMANPASRDVTPNLRDVSNELFSQDVIRRFEADESVCTAHFRNLSRSGNVDTSTLCEPPCSC